MRRTKFKSLGYAWIKGQLKPYYTVEDVKKGKNKGNLRVTYLAGPGWFRKIIIRPSKIHKTY